MDAPKEYGSEARPTAEPSPMAGYAMSLARLTLALALVCGVAAVLSVSSEASRVGGVQQMADAAARASATDDGTVTLAMTNEYERSSGRQIGDGLYPFYVADVSKPTKLALSDGSATIWVILDADGNTWYESAAEEAELELTFGAVGTYTVQVTTPRSWGYTEYTVSARLVRREIRNLSDEERERFFAALHRVYVTEQAEGENLYGPNFRSAAWLVREHLYGAADIECDHWHDDAGILNHHIGITWQLEQSLYSIDNTTAAHYWDYTLDAIEDYDWWDSPIFGDDWFGSPITNNSHKVVTTGRWAYTPVLTGARGFSNITNPYGLLRSPWNTNPTPYLMRSRYTLGHLGDGYTSFPACSCFSSFMMDSSWIGTMLFALNGALHGPVHIMVGGHWSYNPGKWSALSNELSFSDAMLLISKAFWRQGWTRCPSSCSADTPADECVCSCPESVRGNRTAAEIFELAGLWNLNPNSDLLTLMANNGVSDDDLLDLLCEVGHPGEMFTSAAPQDPTFWPLHGLAERFVQYARVLKLAGTLTFSEDWGYAHATNLPSDTGLVCDWSGVHEASVERRETTMPTCVKGTCPGHKIDDTLPFTNLLKTQTGLYTNSEFYELTSPYSEDLPYAYDTLAYWPGCTDDTLISSSSSPGGMMGMPPSAGSSGGGDDDKAKIGDAAAAMSPSKFLRAEDAQRRAREIFMKGVSAGAESP